MLIVDDNATNRRILERTLAHWKMTPVLADGGPAALAALDAGSDRSPLILLDAHMPEMDGFMLAEQILARPDAAGTPIVMLTSGGQPGDAARCHALGVAGYLTKPVKQADLARALLRAREHDGLKPAAPIVPNVVPAVARPLRVLVAEDNFMNQQLAVRLLGKHGHAVTIAQMSPQQPSRPVPARCPASALALPAQAKPYSLNCWLQPLRRPRRASTRMPGR